MPRPPPALRWSTLLAECADSGLTDRAFAAARGISAKRLSHWRAVLRSQRAFVEVSVAEREACSTLAIELLGGRAILRIDAQVDLNLVRRVVEVLC